MLSALSRLDRTLDGIGLTSCFDCFNSVNDHAQFRYTTAVVFCEQIVIRGLIEWVY